MQLLKKSTTAETTRFINSQNPFKQRLQQPSFSKGISCITSCL
jgi:hypothetical protein